MSIIVDEAKEAAYMVDDLLVAARSDVTRLDFTAEAADLRMLAEKVLAAGAIRRSEKLASIDLGSSPVIAFADPHRVRQIVRNLLTNAIRYGGNEVSVDLNQSANDATLRVIDNGAGCQPITGNASLTHT